jgi:hypothetical protein
MKKPVVVNTLCMCTVKLFHLVVNLTINLTKPNGRRDAVFVSEKDEMLSIFVESHSTRFISRIE